MFKGVDPFLISTSAVRDLILSSSDFFNFLYLLLSSSKCRSRLSESFILVSYLSRDRLSELLFSCKALFFRSKLKISELNFSLVS